MGRLAIKVDVDTERGTRDGVLPLAEICQRYRVPAAFLFSLGPDNMGRSLRRLFQPGFLRKVARTRVVANYGLRTLLNGVLWPGPRLGRRYEDILRRVRDRGGEAGIHCHDHYRWQNRVQGMTLDETRAEFAKARTEFHRIFGEEARFAGAPGWLCTGYSLQAYDEAGLVWGSDTRGTGPFQPRVGGQVFRTPQIPTTLPTLDEVLGRPEFPESELVAFYLRQVSQPGIHVMTVHAELEGIRYRHLFDELLAKTIRAGVEFCSLTSLVRGDSCLAARELPICDVEWGEIPGRAGRLTIQGQTSR